MEQKLSEIYLAEYCNEYVEVSPEKWELTGINKTCDEYQWYLKIKALESKNQSTFEVLKEAEKGLQLGKITCHRRLN